MKLLILLFTTVRTILPVNNLELVPDPREVKERIIKSFTHNKIYYEK